MTVISMIPSDTPYLPAKVTEVPKDVLRNFPHTKKVGNYLLGNTLGEGSFAKVKEALHIPTGERVAVKIIDKKKSREDSYVRRNLRREGKILQMIHHPNVVHLLEIMETQNSYYLVTELCRGGDLMDYISKKRKLPEAEVKRYIRQIVSAVDYLHRLGILHRDLKIENLLLDEHRDMKIIDFGLSNCIKVVQSKEGPRAQEFCVTQCGSPAYAAPELLGRKKYGPQVDIWSIGVNMYAMLTGNLPFTVEPFNIKALHTKMVNGQMNPMPDGISRECRDIIKKFLNPDPERRLSIEESLKHPWIAEAPGVPLTRALCPNKVKTESLDNSILKHMSENQGFRISEIIRFVTGNVPSSATAMYYLVLRRLNKHNGNMRSSGRISADYRLLQRAQQDHMNPKILSECQTDWILMRRRVTQRLIWIQTVCKGNNKVASRVLKGKDITDNNKRIMHYNHPTPTPVTRVVTNHTIKSVRNAVNTQHKLKEATEKSEKNQTNTSPESQDSDTVEPLIKRPLNEEAQKSLQTGGQKLRKRSRNVDQKKEDIFTDISKTTNENHITRAASPAKQMKENSNAKHVPTYFPSVATKYAITRRKTVNANIIPAKPNNEGDVIDNENSTATGHLETDEERFRKRASTFPSKAQKPVVELNQLLDDTGDRFVTFVKPSTDGTQAINKPDAKHEPSHAKVNSSVSPRAMSNYRNHCEAIPGTPTSPTFRSNNQYLLLYKKQTNASRKSVSTNHTAVSKDMHSSKGSVTEDDQRGSPVPKHLLARPSRTNKIPRAKLVDRNVLNDELAHPQTERVSEISSTSTRPLSSRNTNVSSSSTRPASPGLPTLPR